MQNYKLYYPPVVNPVNKLVLPTKNIPSKSIWKFLGKAER
jgi:hypothetical protein